MVGIFYGFIRLPSLARGCVQMISYLKSLTLQYSVQNLVFWLTGRIVIVCFLWVEFFFGYESWYQPLYWAVQSALIGISDRTGLL